MYYGNYTLNSQQNPRGVWGGYNSVWHLNESSGIGNYIKDSTSNNYHGTPFGTEFLSSGQIGGARNFLGVGDNRIIIDKGSEFFDGDNIFTFSFWIYPNYQSDAEWESMTDRTVFYKQSSVRLSRLWRQNWMSSGEGRYQADIQFSTYGTTYLNVLLYRQEWTYITYTYDGTYLSSYANGILGPSANIGGFSLIPDSSSFYLGSFNSFKGFLDEFRTSNTAKSQGWIVTEYNNQYNPNAFYLVGDEQSIKPVAYHDAQINAVDLYGNWLPEVTISMYQSTQLKDSDITNSDGSVIFTNIAEGEYNFTATISSNVAAITEIVNSTSSGILINKGFQIINLICNVGTNFFEITDADGAPVESGWVLVGNSSRILRECPIDNSGHTRFWWVNTLPYQYNYSVYYQNNFCNPSTIEVTSGNINTPNTTILKQVPLTTVEFTIITISSPIAPVSGAKLKFRLGDPYGISIANITTDLDGKATLRWLTSTALGGDYSLQIEFFGVNRFFNETLAGPPNVNNVSFTINNAASLEFRISINLLEFQTELVSLNPTDYILAEWGTEVNLRLLFNVTRVESGYENLLGPAYADSIAYQLLLGTTLVRSSSFQKEEIIGRYSVIIDTKTIENEGNYIIKVSGIKSGFTIPSDLIIQLNLLENEVELNQSENDDSAASVFWAENVNMTLNSYGKISESFTVKNAIFQNIDHEFNFLIPDIENQWNLSQIVFNFYNISWNVDISKINITIADPYGSFSYMFHNSNHSGWNYAQGTWLGITLDLNIVSPSFNNKFEFIIGGSFDGTVDISADALFIRDSVNLQYSKYNVSNVISILTESEGWAIKNITFEISNCYNSLTWNKVDLTDTESINITTNEGFKYSLDQGFTDGTGILTIDDFIIYPIGNQFLFTVESDPNVIFNVIIKVEYIQEFYRNLHLEFLNVTKAVSDVNNGGLVQVAATEKTKWADNAATLWVKSIQYNSTYYLPSELAMTITIGGQTFSVLDYVIGTGFISLSGFTRDQILTASIDTLSTVNFNLVLEIAYSKDVFYETLGTLTYEVIGAPTIFGIVSYDSDLGYYLQNIDTTLMDADEYTVRFTFTKGHYTSTMKEFKLIVNERITSINGDLEFYRHLENIYIEEAVNFTFLYTDVLTGERITNLRTQSYIWENYDSDGNVLSSGEGDIISTPSAQYILDFDTETRALGDYMLIITLDKDNYEYKNAMILLTINKRFLHYNLSDRFKNFRANVEQGKNIDITISLTDPTRGGIPLLNATVTLTISGTVYYFEHVANGTYMYSFSTSDINAFFTSQTLRGVINVSKINYISQQFSIIIIVEMPTFLGIPLFYLILIVSSIAVAAAALAGYRIYKNAKVPTYVKKVRSMKKAIKSKKDISESLLYRSKEVFVGENVNYKWEKIGLSLEDILNIKLKKKVLKAEKKISESVTRRELKPLGMVFMRWDERIGAEILNKYPEEVVISEKTLMQIYSTHEYSGEQGVITLSAGALNIISYYTGPETSYYLLLILDMTDDPDLYEGAMADVLRVLLENIENDVYLQLIPSLFQRLSLYPSLSEEEILALQYKDEIKQMIIDNLRDNAIISKSELTIWLREKYIEGFVDIEATLRELIKRDVIKQVSVKGLPSELIVLINDIYMLRVPPVEIFKSPIDRGLPAQFAKEYKEVVKNFFQEYHPSKEDNLKVIGILINPEVYETFRLLRTSIATRQDLEKLRTKGVKDIYGVLKLLWDNNLVKVFRDENNNEYYTLLSDFYMDLIFPKYLLQVIKKAYDQKSIANKALIEFLDVLEDTYYELKTKK
ncbi:MAG: LamG-like jellyroll fold domain-containing protein [Promethearchaeota archaeon]